MRLGNKLIFILFCLIYFFSYSFAEDKITTTPLINLEKIKPSFEETDEKNDFDFKNNKIKVKKNGPLNSSSSATLIGLDKITAKSTKIVINLEVAFHSTSNGLE